MTARELRTALEELSALRMSEKAMRSELAYELESLTSVSAGETERFYRVSSSGRPVLRAIAQALGRVAVEEQNVGVADRPVDVPGLLGEVDRYLAQVSSILSERERWLRG
jgi:hypothetical protein